MCAISNIVIHEALFFGAVWKIRVSTKVEQPQSLDDQIF